ncbi:MAG: flagellar hook-associated protein FlgL [Phycisphaerae bacterium]
MAGWLTIQANTVSSLQQQAKDMTRLQEQASSGMRVIRASDAPADAFRIMNLRSEVRSYEMFKENLSMVEFNMEQVSEVLQAIVTSLSRVQELMTQSASGTYNEDNRRLAGLEIDAILESSISMINAQAMGRNLFGGSQLDEDSYSVSRNSDGLITQVHYQGSQARMRAGVSPGVEYPATVVGEEIFKSQHPGTANMVISNSGTRLGSGTPSARGDLWMTLHHETTTITAPGGLSLAMGNGSDSGDTIFGDHTITVANVGGKNVVQLDGGDQFAFDATSTNLRLVNEDGDIAYLDMSGWSGAYGSATVHSTASASIDGGQTKVLVDPANNNQAVIDSNGDTLFMDFTHTRRIAADPIRVEGTFDLFETLMQVRDTLLNKGEVNHQDQSKILGEQIESVKDLMVGLTQGLTSAGARIQALDGLGTSLETLKFNADTESSRIQDADILEVATELASTQTFYEMILASSSRLLNLSLLDYI